MMFFKPGTFDQRLLAQSLDITFLFPFLLILDGLWQPNSSGFWIACIVIYHLYSVCTEASQMHATIGKKIVGLSIVMTNGETATLKAILLRNLLKWLSLLPISAGFFIIYIRHDGRSLHDIITKTIVVKSSNLQSGGANQKVN